MTVDCDGSECRGCFYRKSHTPIRAVSRYGHGIAAVGSHLLSFGGWDGSKAFSDVLQLNMSGIVV